MHDQHKDSSDGLDLTQKSQKLTRRKHKMANGRSSKGPSNLNMRLRWAHLLIATSCLLLVAVLLSHSIQPARCSSPSTPNSVASPKTQDNDNEEESSCRLEADGDELCAAKLRRKQNATHKKNERPVTSPGRRSLSASNSESDEAQSWRYRYFEEPAEGFEVKVLDDSFDERLANVIYSIVSGRPVNIDFYAYNSGDPLEDAANMAAAAGPHVDETLCGRHLNEMLSLLDEINEKLAHRRKNSSIALEFSEKHLRLARVLDSYGRYEAGHLTGKQHAPGYPDQCTSTNLLLSNAAGDNHQHVPAGFCWARMDLSKHLNVGLARRSKSPFEAAEHPLKLGICLPRTCHSKTFAANRERIQRLVDSQFQLPKSLYIEETLRVGSLYCSVDSESAYARLPLVGRLALGFLIGWLALTLYATFNGNAGGDHQPFWDCLDLRKSLQDFVGEHEDAATQARLDSQMRQRKIDLDTLNPIKVMGCAFVVLGHALILHAAIALNGLEAFHTCETDPVVLGMVAGTVVVDTFFVITGMLMGYVVMQQANRRKVPAVSQVDNGNKGHETANGQIASTSAAPVDKSYSEHSTSVGRTFLFHWVKFAVSRHLRLVPLFFLVFWVKKSVLISYFSSWPLWDAGFNKDTNYGACRQESWSTPFSILAAFYPLSKQCLPQAWSVASDLFFSMTIPPVMLIMPRRPKLALAIGVAMTLMSNLLALSAYHSVDPHMAYEMNDLRAHGFAYMFGSIHHLYTYPHFRFGSILIGLVAGYYLYYFGEQSDELKQWPGWFRGPATKASFGTILAIVFGFASMPVVKYYIAPYHQSFFTNLFTSGRIVWALCNAVLLTRMVSDWRHNFLMRIYSNRFWRALARLNLSILLIHLDVLLYFLYSSTHFDYFGKRTILINFGTAYFYCIPLATLLHIIYENPINKLIRRFVTPRLFAS